MRDGAFMGDAAVAALGMLTADALAEREQNTCVRLWQESVGEGSSCVVLVICIITTVILAVEDLIYYSRNDLFGFCLL